MNKHTPGPWFVGRMLDPKNAPCVIGDGDSVVAILPGEWNGCTYIESDAVLAAAAPDLLAALRWYVENDDTNVQQDGNEFYTAGLRRAEAAIAKATGEQP